jgi:hypothetical protein
MWKPCVIVLAGELTNFAKFCQLIGPATVGDEKSLIK